MSMLNAVRITPYSTIGKAVGRFIVRALIIALALIALYLGLALAGSLLPANNGWIEPRQGVQIFVYSNGTHTGIVVPTVNDVQDWRAVVKPEHLSDPRYGKSDHLLFGWGERNFYLMTPTWSDVRISVAAKSLFFSRRTLLHLDYIHSPVPGPNMRPVTISKAQYVRLVQQIEGFFRRDEKGNTLPVKGYGPADKFYESNGHYNVMQTCNNWTGAQLRSIGVRVGIWTPFSQSVMWWFANPSGRVRQ
ncbi:TIGR02117 family protein [Rhizorhapis sp. SPR117]|uniref:TIGR02117 family protein n=1 Tax=Rhizorhapis sp. SPR117 TaxID=2912611 RepID=UPI001F1CCC36|nr:TIGR02117 family protein [Rhizorhapis sp. SPR117]